MTDERTTYMPVPLDFRLLEILPEKGMIGGIHWKGRRTKDVLAEIIDGDPELAQVLTSPMLMARLRSMHVGGLVEPFAALGNASKIWARTTAGTEWLAKKEEVLGVMTAEPNVPYKAKPKKGSRVGLSDAAVTGLDLNGLGSAEIVTIEWINVDGAYQRDLRHDLVNEIGTSYDIIKAGAILLSVREDGTLWCVDGQHRLAGAQQAGETEIFAHVVHGLTQAQEAELRLARNVRRSDTIAEKFRTRLVMGDPKAHQIIELVGQHYTELNLIPNSYHGINAIATVEMLYDISDDGVWLSRTLRAIREAYTEGTDSFADNLDPCMNPETCSTSMLKAVCWFLGQHIDNHEVPYQEFVDRIGQLGPEDIRRKAISHKAANGGALWLNNYRALVEIWNFRRTDAKKIKWKTIGSIAKLGSGGTKTTSWSRADQDGSHSN